MKHLAVSILVVLLGAIAATTSALQEAGHLEFCVIGGGPGGLQAAYYLQQLGFEYAVFERGARAGNFFVKYPRHRGLISINKVYTGRDDPEFNLRHDWNSLLYDHIAELDNPDDVPASLRGASNDSVSNHQRARATREPLLFKHFTTKYYPKADYLVDYLNAYVDRHDLNVYLNHNVVRVAKRRRVNGIDKPSRLTARPIDDIFVVYVESTKDRIMKRFTCDVMILGTGKYIPIKPQGIKGGHLVQGYEDISMDPKDFVNQEILVFGMGNSALELLRNIEDVSATVHLTARRPMTMAYQSHYVGDARGPNLAAAEKYLLKSQDALLAGLDLTTQVEFFFNNATKRIHVRQLGRMEGPDGLEEPNAGRGYHRVIRCLGFHWDASIFGNRTIESLRALPSSTCSIYATASSAPECKPADAGEETKRSEVAQSEIEVIPQTDDSGIYAVVASNFASPNVPHLFVAGTLMHYRDHKRSAGGFIHGFRYLVRTLVWQLRERYVGIPYPAVPLGPKAPSRAALGESGPEARQHQRALVDALIEHVKKRLPSVSSLYQMQSQLCDVILLHKDGRLRVLHDIPLDQVRSGYPNATNVALMLDAPCMITMSIEFGPYFHGVGVLHHQGQADPEYKKRMKTMFKPNEDPDLELGFFAAHPNLALSSDAATVVEQRNEERRQRKRANSMVPGVDDADLPPLEPRPDLRRDPKTGEVTKVGGKSEYGHQFIHPVFRLFVRDSDVVGAAKEASIHRFIENLDNDWTRPKTHLEPLREYLIPAMRRMAGIVNKARRM